jgi:hypothetical protein
VLNLGKQRPVHVLDITSVDGLFDVIALGNIIEFGVALDHRTYTGQPIKDEERDEHAAARTRWRTLMRWYSDNFCLLIGSEWVNPMYLFKRRIADFGATVDAYARRELPQEREDNRIANFNPKNVRTQLRRHVRQTWLDLLPYFELALDHPSHYLYYCGPDQIHVHP